MVLVSQVYRNRAGQAEGQGQGGGIATIEIGENAPTHHKTHILQHYYHYARTIIRFDPWIRFLVPFEGIYQ